jgi:hypothetical protein
VDGRAILTVDTVVTLLAGAAQSAEPERNVVAAMWLDMIGNARSRDVAAQDKSDTRARCAVAALCGVAS